MGQLRVDTRFASESLCTWLPISATLQPKLLPGRTIGQPTSSVSDRWIEADAGICGSNRSKQSAPLTGLFTLLLLALFSFFWSLASLWLSIENRRFSRVRFLERCGIRRREHRAMLVVPVKGGDPDLESNLQAFFEQQHPNFELLFVVESRLDPAWPVVVRLKERFPSIHCRLVASGLADGDGQKVHNLLVATSDIPERIRILAFADADIRPDPEWLQTLCYSVAKAKNRAAITGYRWMLPEKNSLANLCVFSINSTLAGTLGVGSHYLVWGGSWAMQRTRFEQLGIRQAWQGTLSDDLVATRAIKQQGQRIAYDPRCLCKTYFDLTALAGAEFLRRQFVIGRKYAPRLFWSSLSLMLVNVVTWWWLAGLALLGTGVTATWAGWGLAILYGTSIIKGALRQSVFYLRDSNSFRRYAMAAVFDILAWPLVATITLAFMISAVPGNTICWRGNRYLIRPGGQIQLLSATIPSDLAVARPDARSEARRAA